MGPGLTWIFLGKIVPKYMILWSRPSIDLLLKVASYYDLSVLSMSVMDFQNKNVGWG